MILHRAAEFASGADMYRRGLCRPSLKISRSGDQTKEHNQARNRPPFHNVAWHGLVQLGAGLHWDAVASQMVNWRGV
jgi:hypothetical protein